MKSIALAALAAFFLAGAEPVAAQDLMNLFDDMFGAAEEPAADEAAPPLAGGGAVAMVEKIIGAPQSGLEELDYLYAGDVIELGAEGELVLEFLDICRRELIVGGTVQVTAQGSKLEGGRLGTQRTECRQFAALITAEASEAGATVDRVTPEELTGDFWQEQVIKTERPIFKWRSEGVPKVKVRLLDMDRDAPAAIWQAATETDHIAYPDDAPPLQVGRPYMIEVGQGERTSSALFSIDPELDIGDLLTSRVVAIDR